MCKIVARYALHHRVASSPSALFLPLTFFRSLLSSLYSPSFALSLERVSSGYCQCLPLCIFLLFFTPLPPLIFFVSFFLITLYLFSARFFSSSLTFPASFSYVPYISRSFFIFRSYFSLISFFCRIFLSLANSFPLLILFMSSLFFSVSFCLLSLQRFLLKNASLHTVFLE